MFNFTYLDKARKTEYLPLLFDILYSNMREIAPSGLAYELEKAEFENEVGSALEKEPRQIILCFCKDELAGFLMFYTRENIIMIEELQLIKKYQRTRLLYLLCKYMIEILPQSIEFIESFAHKSNRNSISLQEKLGMEIIESISEELFHLRGSAKVFKSKIR